MKGPFNIELFPLWEKNREKIKPKLNKKILNSGSAVLAHAAAVEPPPHTHAHAYAHTHTRTRSLEFRCLRWLALSRAMQLESSGFQLTLINFVFLIRKNLSSSSVSTQKNLFFLTFIFCLWVLFICRPWLNLFPSSSRKIHFSPLDTSPFSTMKSLFPGFIVCLGSHFTCIFNICNNCAVNSLPLNKYFSNCT